MSDEKLVPVVLLRHFRIYNPGETIGLPPEEAEACIAAGMAKAYEVEKPQAPKEEAPKQEESKAVESPPVDRMLKGPPAARSKHKKE